MNILDLKLAANRLVEKRLNLCIVKEQKVVFETTSQGISGFLNAIEKFRDDLVGACVADRVVGKAIALLCVYSKVKAVYALTFSENAKALLLKEGIYVEWDVLVENVLDHRKAEVCPFEKTATEIANPEDAYRKLKALQQTLRECG